MPFVIVLPSVAAFGSKSVPFAICEGVTVTVSVWPTFRVGDLDKRERVDGRVVIDRLIGNRAGDRWWLGLEIFHYSGLDHISNYYQICRVVSGARQMDDVGDRSVALNVNEFAPIVTEFTPV